MTAIVFFVVSVPYVCVIVCVKDTSDETYETPKPLLGPVVFRSVVPVIALGDVAEQISEPAMIRAACVVVTELGTDAEADLVALLNGPADVAFVFIATILTIWFDVVVETTLYVPTGGLMR
jgi:hypothetical protein